MPTDGRRIQKRTPASVALQVSSAKQPFITELAFTENVSLHGVRVGWTLRNPQECKCSPARDGEAGFQRPGPAKYSRGNQCPRRTSLSPMFGMRQGAECHLLCRGLPP